LNLQRLEKLGLIEKARFNQSQVNSIRMITQLGEKRRMVIGIGF